MNLNNAPVGPIIPVSDLARSRDFYEGRLGLTGEPAPGGWRLQCGGETAIYLLTGTDYAGQAAWPLASFAVADIGQTLSDLGSSGVSPIRFDSGDQKTDERGIARLDGQKIAWITDPDEQVISLFEP